MPVHFEIHVSDIARAKTFYTQLFGWTYEPMPGANDYNLVSGDDIGVGKGLSGALMKRNAPEQAPHSGPRGAILVIEVKDVDGTYAAALANGGAEALPPTDFEGVGRVAYVEDGEGNIIGMIQPPKGAA